jgi:hypothetical protein
VYRMKLNALGRFCYKATTLRKSFATFKRGLGKMPYKLLNSEKPGNPFRHRGVRLQSRLCAPRSSRFLSERHVTELARFTREFLLIVTASATESDVVREWDVA